MSSVNYENQILNAIETIVDNAVSKANYDRTIRGVVSKCVDESTGKYVIRYQNSSFYAYGNAGDNIYAGGTPVYVMIPSNDMSQRKTIVGSVSEMGSDYITISESAEGYEVVGNNVINSNGETGLCSYTPNGETIVLYDKDDEENALIDINTFAATEYLQKSNYLMIGADFRTSLATEQKLRGNYGLAFDLSFDDNNGGDPIIRTYIIDINNMVGNPYEFSEATNQKAVFEIDGANFKTIDKVYVFEYNFPNEDENITDEDIFISNFSLEAAEALSAQELSGYSLTLVTPQGIYFDDNDLDSATRRMEAVVKIKGKTVNPESNLLKYYWFKENNKVTSTHENYNRYGGAGWECLNTYTSAGYDSDNHELKEWNPDVYYKIVTKQNNPGEENTYKCVVLYNDTTIIEKEITFYNYSSDYEITIESDSGNYFYYDVGHPTLTCYVNGEAQTGAEWSYQWGMVDNNNQYTMLEETPEVTQEDLMKIEKNVIHNLLLSMVVSFSTFKCFVYRNNTYVGKASISIVNSRSVAQNTYSLIIDNGNQIFKYNEDGISPANRSLENPQEIYPLSFTLFDDMGREVNKDAIKTKDISWIVPEKETMIKVSNVHGNPTSRNERDGTATYTQYKELYFDIATLYNAKNTKNTIQLIVKYKDKILSAKTNLSFLKEGENGSNGTNFICRIIPNVADLSTVNGYPTVYYNKDAAVQTGRNPVINYTPLGANVWFKVEFWHDGERIYNGTQSGTSTEGKSVEIKWSMLKNKYTTLQLDQSNYNINENTGIFSFNPLTINNGDSADEIKKKTNPANIVKCTIKYDNQVYYATIPLITVIGSGTDYKGFLKEYTGFRYAMYTTDGILPTYDNTNPFTLDVFKNDENISLNDDLVYNWNVKGLVLYDKWTEENNLMEKNVYGQNLELNQANYKPIDAFNGYCVTNALSCNIEEDNNEILYIHIPIQLYLNRFGNPAMNSWDGNHIEINNDGGFILSPQVGAGTKDENNAFTGVFMGEIQESGKKSPEYGLYGYYQGERTIALNSEDGSARFGKIGKGQIVLDPTDDTAVLRSGDYEPAIVDGSGNILSPGSGLEIDLTDPHIYFGSGKFRVDKNGDVYADGFATIQDLSAGNYNIPGTENFKVICATDTVQFETNAEHYPTQAVTKTITCRCLYKDSVTSDYTVTLVDSNGNTITHNTNSDGIEFNLTKNGNTTTISFAAATSRIITNAINNFFIKFTHTSSGLDLTKVFYANLIILGADGQDGEVGPPGPAGKDGTSVTVKGTYPSVADLCNAVSAGTITPVFGDGYVIGNDLYIFTDGASGGGTLANDWNDVGQFKGEDAKRCFIVASSEVFKSSDGGTSYTPNSVTITPYLQAVNFSGWSYSINGGSSFTNLTSPYPSGISINNNVITLTKDCELFTNAVSTISFKCSTNNANVYDIITITKIKDGVNGNDGRGIASTEIKYINDNQGTTPPNDSASWENSPPVEDNNKRYLWTRTRITYTDAINPTTSYSVSYKGINGTNGTSVTILSQEVKYAEGENGITAPEIGWQSSIPNIQDGKFLWTRTKVNYSGGASTTSYSVSYQSKDGTDAIQYYIHIMYAMDDQGSGMSPSSTGKNYIGILIDNLREASETASLYTWSKFIGENGANGTNGFSLWTTTAAPSNNIYTRNQLVGPSTAQNPRIGEIIIRSNRYQYTVTAVNGNNITVGSMVDLRGSNGTSATNIVCGNEAQTITCDSEGKTLATTIITIPFAGYIGNTRAVCTVVASNLPTGITVSSNTAASTSADGSLVLSIGSGSTLGRTNTGEITLTFTCNSLTFVKKFAWSKALTGAKGDPGANGTSPYVAYLTNEAQTFVYGTAKDITTQLYAYQGTTEKTVTIKTVNGKTASTSSTETGKTGMSFKISSTSATAHPTITFSATTALAQGQAEQLAIVFRITGESVDRTIYFSYSSTTRGATGAAASLVDISASSQVFKSTDGGTTFSPNTIVLTPRFQTVTYNTWQYDRHDGQGFKAASGANGVTIANGVLTITKDSTLFDKTHSTITFKCISSNSAVYDTVTIVKLYDVSDIQIGGRNYILNSNFSSETKKWNNWGSPTTRALINSDKKNWMHIVGSGTAKWQGVSQNAYSSDNIKIDGNGQYIFSARVKGAAANQVFTVGFHWFAKDSTTIATQSWKDFTIGTTEQIVSWIINVGNYDHFNLMVGVSSESTVYDVSFTELKFEKGNKVTSWSPAPEDIEMEMSTTIVESWSEYNIGSSTQNAPSETDTGWTTGLSTANIGKNQYLWTRTANRIKNGNIFYSGYTCLIQQQKELIKQYTQYKLHNNDQIPPAMGDVNAWSNTKPTENDKNNPYLWARTVLEYKYIGGTEDQIEPVFQDVVRDTTWNTLFSLTGSLEESVGKLQEAIGSGVVRLIGGNIVVGDNLEHPTKFIIMNSAGIGFYQQPSGQSGWIDAATAENATSTWQIDGTLNMQNINVVNLAANSIANQNLNLGNQGTSGDLDIYDSQGNLIFETVTSSGFIEGFKIYKYKKSGTTLIPNGYIYLSREKGFQEFNSGGKEIFGNNGSEHFASKINRTQQQIVTNKAPDEAVSGEYGIQMIAMSVSNAGDGLTHKGIAFLGL